MLVASKRFVWLAALVGAALVAPAARADVIISTLGSATGPASPWGTPDSGSTPTYGQLFVDPAGNPFLQSMTFDVANSGATPIPFQAYVFAWNGAAITGPALFTSAPLAIPPGGSTFHLVTVPTLNTQLTPGNQYVAFFSTIGFTGPSGSGQMELTPQALYPQGSFEYNNSSTFAGLSGSSPWDPFGNFNSNLEFQLVFTSSPAQTTAGAAVPEPSSFALLALSGAALAFWRRKRRKSAAA